MKKLEIKLSQYLGKNKALRERIKLCLGKKATIKLYFFASRKNVFKQQQTQVFVNFNHEVVKFYE